MDIDRANDWWGKTYKQAFGVEKPGQGMSVLTGCSAGATESFVVVPFELVKIRLQDRNSAGKYKGPLDCVAQVIKHEGVLGMYHGLEPTFWRSASPVHYLPGPMVMASIDMSLGMVAILAAYFKFELFYLKPR